MDISYLFKNLISTITGKVNEAKDYTDTTFNALADYVVENGTANGWQYRKWNSGVAECWQVTNITSESFTNVYGNGWYKAYSDWLLPAGLFNDIPSVTGTLWRNGGLCFIMLHSLEKDKIGFYVASLKSEGAANTRFMFHAKGRWK